MTEIINTDRLTLAKLGWSDAPFIYELLNTAEWIRYIGNRNINSIQDAQNYIQKIIDNPNIVYWIVKLKDEISSMGIITFIKRDYLAYYDIGFAFLPKYTKNGYAYEASKAVLDEIIKTQLHTHILATTMKENCDSIRLLERLGLTFDKEIQIEKTILLIYVMKLTN